MSLLTECTFSTETSHVIYYMVVDNEELSKILDMSSEDYEVFEKSVMDMYDLTKNDNSKYVEVRNDSELLPPEWKLSSEYSEMEKEVIQSYKGLNYDDMNKFMRGLLVNDNGTIDLNNNITIVDSEKVKEVIKETENKCKVLANAIDRYEISGNIKLYRGAGSKTMLSKYSIDYYDSAEQIYSKLTQNGDIYQEDTFMSTSTINRTAFIAKSDVVFEINCKKGVKALNYGVNENEVLLQYGQKFKIDGVERIGSKIMIKMTTI